jgi:hypothetical protein
MLRVNGFWSNMTLGTMQDRNSTNGKSCDGRENLDPERGLYRLVFLPLTLWLLLVIGSSVAAETGADIKPFFGRYEGQSITLQKGNDFQEFDLGVTISPYNGGGFKIEWSTILPSARKTSQRDRKSHSVYFSPYSKRPGLYFSAVKRNMFGHMRPTDPLAGDPYFWAGLAGKTLTVNVLYVTDAIGWEMHIYRRTLTPDGLVTEFQRIRDGFKEEPITGRLKKLD